MLHHHLTVLALFRKQKLNLKPQLPIRTELRLRYVAVCCELRVNRQFRDRITSSGNMSPSLNSEATTEGNCPDIAGFPVGRENR
jgi:hypothetical protein